MTYEPFGNITTLPAADAGGSELKTGYYSDNHVATQTQNGQTNAYTLDPDGRTLATIATTGSGSTEAISHYAGSGDSPAWTTEPTSGAWTRYIDGIGGGLAAIQSSSGSIALQLTDLDGNIVATAPIGETGKDTPATETNEYGVPREGSTPSKYTWLGADQRATELPSGIIAMGARSYVPQLGRFLQEDPIEGGSANAYAYTYGEPVNSADPSGESTIEQWAINGSGRVAQEGVQAREAELAAIKAAEEQAAREEAERQAAAAAVARQVAYEAMNWSEKYADGGPSLLEVYAARGVYPGQWAGAPGETAPEEGGGGANSRFITAEYKKDPCAEQKNKNKARQCPKSGNWHELVEVVNEVIGLVQCVAEDGNCPDFGAPPHR